MGLVGNGQQQRKSCLKDGLKDLRSGLCLERNGISRESETQRLLPPTDRGCCCWRWYRPVLSLNNDDSQRQAGLSSRQGRLLRSQCTLMPQWASRVFGNNGTRCVAPVAKSYGRTPDQVGLKDILFLLYSFMSSMLDTSTGTFVPPSSTVAPMAYHLDRPSEQNDPRNPRKNMQISRYLLNLPRHSNFSCARPHRP